MTSYADTTGHFELTTAFETRFCFCFCLVLCTFGRLLVRDRAAGVCGFFHDAVAVEYSLPRRQPVAELVEV